MNMEEFKNEDKYDKKNVQNSQGIYKNYYLKPYKYSSNKAGKL